MATTKVIIAGTPYRIKIVGGRVAWKPKSVVFFPPQISNEDASEAQLPTDKRPSITIRDVSDGYGQDEQPLDGPIRQFNRIGDAQGEGIDASLTPEGPIVLAAALWTPVAGGSPSQPILRAVQYDTNRARVFYTNNVYTFAAWEANDIGTLSSAIMGQPVVFRGTQSAEHWYASLGAGVTPQYSTNQGTTWANVTTTGGFTEARDMTVVDGEVVYLYTGQYGFAIRRFQDGGVNPTVYGTIDPVTQQSNTVAGEPCRLLNWGDRAVILTNREAMVLARDKSELTQNILPEVTESGDSIYTHGACVWRGILLIPTTRGVAALSPGGTTQWIGPGNDLLHKSGATARGTGVGHRGLITALAGDAYNLYGFLGVSSDELATDPAWLMKANVSVSNGAVADIDWFPFLHLGAVDTCYGMAVIGHRKSDAEPQTVKSLVFATAKMGAAFTFANGNMRLIRLPMRGRDPRADENYRYALNGTFYASRLNARFMAFEKDWLSLLPRTADLGYGVDGQTAVTGLGIQVRYKADTVPLTAAGPYGYSTTVTQGAPDGTGARVDLSGARARGLDLAVRFSTSHAFSNQSPQLNAITADYRPAPEVVMQHSFVLDFSAGSYADDGQGGYGDPVTPDVALHRLMTLPGKAPFAVVLPDGRDVTCFCVDADPTVTGVPDASYGNDGALPMDIGLTLVEVSPTPDLER